MTIAHILTHSIYVSGFVAVTLIIFVTALELYLSVKMIKNVRMKHFLNRAGTLLLVYCCFRIVGAALDEWLLTDYIELWISLGVTLGFWLSMFTASHVLRRDLKQYQADQAHITITEFLGSRRNLITDIDKLLSEMERGKLSLNELNVHYCPTKPPECPHA